MSEVTRACKTCNGHIGWANRTGYCQKCVGRALPCVMAGCDGRVHAASRRGYCIAHKAIAAKTDPKRIHAACQSCGGPVSVANRSGYCVTCVDTAKRCTIEGCDRPIAAWSKRGVCSWHIGGKPKARPSRWDGWL